MLAHSAELMHRLGFDEVEPWNAGPALTREEVLAATPVLEAYEWPQVRPRAWHAGRIHALAGRTEPIMIDVDEYGELLLADGNHRLHAAHLVGAGVVGVELSGFVDEYDA